MCVLPHEYPSLRVYLLSCISLSVFPPFHMYLFSAYTFVHTSILVMSIVNLSYRLRNAMFTK